MPGRNLSYAYDGIGKRTSAKYTSYTPNALNQYSQITTSGQADILVRAPERVTASVPGASSVVVTPAANEPSVLDYYDANGNIIAYSDQTDRLVQRRDYDPFGNPVVTENLLSGGEALASHLTFAFSTKPRDPETGLLYYGHRYYDPVHGRWPSRDPIGEDGGINLYGFVGNDGVGREDLLGLMSLGMGYLEQDVKCTVILEVGHTHSIIARVKKWNERRTKFEAEEPNHAKYQAQMSGVGCAIPFAGTENRLIEGFRNESPYDSMYPIPNVPKNRGWLGQVNREKKDFYEEPAHNGGFNPVTEGEGKWDPIVQTHGFLEYMKRSWDAAIESGLALAGSNSKYKGFGETE